MKVTFIGVFDNPNSTNVAQARGFEENGHLVTRLDYRRMLKNHGSPQVRDHNIKLSINGLKPDLTIFSKCNGMSYTVVEEANKHGKTCLWYMDPLNQNYDFELIDKIRRASIACFGLWAPLYESKLYNPNSYFIEQCYDDKVHYYEPGFEQIHDSMFIGDITPYGETHAERMHYQNKVGFPHTNSAFTDEHRRLVLQTKVNINFTEIDRGGTSVRLHKILATKGFLVTQPWMQMEQSFTPDKDFATFTNPDELASLIDNFACNDKGRQEIAEHGYQTVQQYTPKNWARKIVECL